MGFGATIMARLGLDTSGFSKPLRDAGNEAEQAHRRMAQGAKRNSDAHDGLWKSENRVERQIGNVAQTVLSGADAFEVATASVDALAKSLHLSLGTAAGIGIGVLAFERIAKMREEAKKLRDEITKLVSTPGMIGSDPLMKLEERLKSVGELMKRLRTEESSLQGGVSGGGLPGYWERAKQGLKDFAEAASRFDGTSVADVQRERRERMSQLGGTESKTFQDAANERGAKSALANDKSIYAEARKAIAANDEDRKRFLTPGSKDENQRMADVLGAELEAALKSLADAIAAKRNDRVNLSLADVASGPGYGDQNKASLQAISNSDRAREAQRLRAEAANDVLYGGEAMKPGAQTKLNRADELVNGIGTVKDSEKDLKGEFMGALDSSKVLQEIKENTAKPLTNGGR